MKSLALWGSSLSGKSRVVSAQRRLNCYTEQRADGDKTQVTLIGTPGLSNVTFTLPTTPDGPVRGWLASSSQLHVVMGSYYFKLHADGTTGDSFAGTVLTNSGPVSFATNGTQVLMVDGVAGYIQSAFDSTGGTLTVISDPDFPNGCKTCAFLGGFFAVDSPAFAGRYQISASYDGTIWSGTDFATAEQDPDPLQAVDVDHGTLILYGTKSIEFWQLSGAVNFPFAPMPGSTQQYGLAAVYSRAHIANTMLFLGTNTEGQVQVMALGTGFQAQRVSTSDVETIINSFPTVSDAVALVYRTDDGHSMYQISFPTASRSFLFDATEEEWHEVQTGVAVQARHIGQYSVYWNNQTLVSDYNSTNIYYQNPSSYTDAGTPIKRQFRTRHILDNFNYIGVDEVYLNMESGVGLPTGQGSDPQIMLQVSRDDGRTFGPEKWVKFGQGGHYKTPRAVWRRFGMGRDFVFQFTMSDPVKFVCTGGALTVRERPQ